jgi:hypothetical protein
MREANLARPMQAPNFRFPEAESFDIRAGFVPLKDLARRLLDGDLGQKSRLDPKNTSP